MDCFKTKSKINFYQKINNSSYMKEVKMKNKSIHTHQFNDKYKKYSKPISQSRVSNDAYKSIKKSSHSKKSTLGNIL